MDWLQFATFLVVNIGFMFTLWLWSRAENRADNRNLESIIQGIREDGKLFQQAILAESKDFHGRLCAIEERTKKT